MNCKDFIKNILMIIYCVILFSGDNIAGFEIASKQRRITEKN